MVQANTGPKINKKKNSNSSKSLLVSNRWPKSLRTLGTRLGCHWGGGCQDNQPLREDPGALSTPSKLVIVKKF